MLYYKYIVGDEMNKKGFTLVELLAVLFIILLLGSLVFISINEKGEQFKDISYDKFEETIITAAQSYVSEDDKMINSLKRGDTTGRCDVGIEISIEQLINLKYLDGKNLKNPKTYKNIDVVNSYVCAQYKDYNYTYKVILIDTKNEEE